MQMMYLTISLKILVKMIMISMAFFKEDSEDKKENLHLEEEVKIKEINKFLGFGGF